jgi:hypothetical protein
VIPLRGVFLYLFKRDEDAIVFGNNLTSASRSLKIRRWIETIPLDQVD